jgi:dTDP-4-amino-4,6-dideoxygalactose transaminase
MSTTAPLTDRRCVGHPHQTVPFFSQATTFESLWPRIRAHVNEVVDHGKYSHGRKVAELEAALAAWTGARFVVGVNSGTDALVLLLRGCGLCRGDDVVVPAFTFIATASSVVLAGGRPVFADIDPTTYAIDPGSLADAITPATRMVMPVHLFCQMADMDAVGDVARRRALTVVEDSAEALGMRWNGAHAGLLGRGGVLSFFPAKTLGAVGDAGAILTNDRNVAETAAALRHHGRFGPTLDDFSRISTPTGIPGVNSKMDDIQAAVLLAKMSRIEQDIARRAEVAAAYTERLCDVDGVTRLPTVVGRPAETNPVFYVYLVEVEDRDGLAAYLGTRGIGTEIYYPRPLHLQPCFAALGYGRGDFPHAERACERAIALPLYPDLSLETVDYVSDSIRGFFAGRRP